jgi:phage pi2 protein 07
MPEETITITKKEYESLLEDSKKLLYLEGAGVDNWEGYDLAMEQMNEEAE